MSTEQQKALDKIKKCLKLAGSSNPNEAATALRQAQALMEKYNVNYADVLAADASASISPSTVKKKPLEWECYLARIASEAFSCKLVFSSSPFAKKADWKFIGVGSMPELAAYAFSVLLRQVKRDRTEYIKTKLGRCGLANKTKRADVFCNAWVYQAGEKIVAIAPSKEASQAITAYMEKHYGKAGTLNPRESKTANSQVNYMDAHAGLAAGRNANLNRGVDSSAPVLALEH